MLPKPNSYVLVNCAYVLSGVQYLAKCGST